MKKLDEAYSEIGIATDVMSASGHRLIQLMLDKCLQHIEIAKSHILSKDYIRKGQSISKALDIVEYLRVCLNHSDEKAKKLAEMLDALYAYLQKNLVNANIKNDIQLLDDSKKVLANIKEGWDGIG
jgi:flagellar protein FliS